MKLNKKFFWYILGSLALAAILILIAIFSQSQSQYLKVIVHDIGQGDAIFIETPEKYQILIDGGPDSSILAKLGKDLPFYDRSLDLVILTHPHDDHVTGLIDVLKRYDVEQILYTGVSHTAPNYIKWLEIIKDKGVPLEIAQSGQIIKLGETSELYILYPFEDLTGEKVKNLNNTSILCRLIYDSTSFLFTGDAEKEEEQDLIDHNIYLKSDVLKVGHHGSNTSSTENFLKAVSPEIGVISAGKDNRFGHPSDKLLERLENNGIKIYRTDKNGDIEIVSDGREIEVQY